MYKILLKIKTELFFLKLKYLKGISKKELHESIRCTFDLENRIKPDMSFNEYLLEYF